jgi:hypothetical protein
VAALLGRGRTRAFADLAPDATVQIGAITRAATLDTSRLLPKAMGAYLDAMKPSRSRKADSRTQLAEKAHGMAAATACGAAMRRLKESKTALFGCSFGLDVCDEAKQSELAKNVDAARADAEAAYRDLDGARVGAAANEATALTQAAEVAGCREPWW